MANANTPRGLIPYRYASGAHYNGAFNVYSVPATYATNLFVGDPVVATGAADANGIPVVQIASAGGGAFTLGPMVGVVPAGTPQIAVTRDLPVYRQASVAAYIAVADDPNLLFWVQEDSVGGSIATATSGMKNADLVSGSGSTTTGYSGWMLDSSTIATTSTLQLRIMTALQEVDNVVGTGDSFAKWLVRINNHSITRTTGV